MKKLKIVGACALFGLSMNVNAGGSCPDPDVAWDTTNQANGGTYSVTDTGAAGTSCKLSVQQGPNNNGIATVRDDMASAETSYRARFYVDATELMAGGTGAAHRFKAFVAGNSTNSYQGTEDTKARPALMQMFLVSTGANTARLGGFCRTITDDGGADGDRARFGDGDNVELVTGWNVVEVQITTGAGDGSCSIWVNNDVEGSPNWSVTTLTNDAMVGVMRANIGSTGATQAYATDLGTAVTDFDEFESRRQTFIGSLAP